MAGKRLPNAEELRLGIISGDRVLLSRAITLIESNHPDHQLIAEDLLNNLISSPGKSLRIGITGVPGVGKSTFIEAFGKYLTTEKIKVAVLSIDPSSSKSKGSILGDKTRMNELSKDPLAYIRPSPAGNSLGGVSKKTRESIFLCEAAGYEVVIVETVGVGQSETLVKDMVDYFLLLMLSGGGDELQGIKRGIMEMADGIAINKSDGDNLKLSEISARNYKNAIHLFPPNPNGWTVPVTTCSSVENTGIPKIWEQILGFEALTKSNRSFYENRKSQNLHWFRQAWKEDIEHYVMSSPKKKQLLENLENELLTGKITVRSALRQFRRTFINS